MAFVYPGFLFGMVGVAIPIAIHLFELRRPQRVLFSNVEFIREVKLVTARQRKLKQLAVLAARMGLVVALSLLFAQPFIPAPEQTDTGGAVRVVLDQSPSMRQLGAQEQPLLEQAVQEAAALPLAFPASTRFNLVPGKEQEVSAPEFRTQVEQVQVTGQANSISRELERLQQSQAGSRRTGPTFVFSDFQKSTFSGSAIPRLDSTAGQVFLVPLGSKSNANVFVDSVWLNDAFVRANTDLTLHIRLRNGGEQRAENCQAKLYVGAQQAASFQASIGPQQAVTQQVRIRLTGQQNQRCRVVVDDYPVDFDNTYYFTLQPAAQLRVVEVAAERQLDRLYGNEPLFAYQFSPAQTPAYQALTAANLVIVREVPSLAAGLREGIRRAAQRGATVVVVPSAAAGSPETYRQLFRELGVGPVQWQGPGGRTAPVLQELAMPDARNPFFRDVFAGMNQRAGMPKAAPLLSWSRSGTDVLRLRDGQGFLAGFPVGSGTVYVFASPFAPAYSDFAQHPLFVPVMYRLALQSYQQAQQPAYRLNQGTVTVELTGPKPSPGREPVYQLVQDSAKYIPVQRKQGNTLRLEVPPGLRTPGFYTLQQAGQAVATLAFNFDKRESDLRSYSAAELKQLVGGNPAVHVYETGQGQTVAARYKATRVGVPLWQYCLWAALACLLLEAALIRWQRPKATAPALAA